MKPDFKAIEDHVSTLRSNESSGTHTPKIEEAPPTGDWRNQPSYAELAEQVRRLREALMQIYDNSLEENEWDAVDKLHHNEKIAGIALKYEEPK